MCVAVCRSFPYFVVLLRKVPIFYYNSRIIVITFLLLQAVLISEEVRGNL